MSKRVIFLPWAAPAGGFFLRSSSERADKIENQQPVDLPEGDGKAMVQSRLRRLPCAERR